MKRIGVVVAMGLGLLLAAAPAWAQQYPPQVPTAGVSDATLFPGQSTVVSGQGWMGGSTVLLSLLSGGPGAAAPGAGTPLGTARVAADGTFSTTVTIDADPGDYRIAVTGPGADGTRSTVYVNVTVLGAAGGGGATAGTGASITAGMLLVVALVIAGLLALAAGRRRGSKVDSDR